MNILRNSAIAAGAIALIGVGVLVTTDTGFARDHKHGARGGDAMSGERGGHRRGMRLMQRFDTNGDLQITQDEIDSVQATRFALGDSNADNVVTLDEFQVIWMQDNRQRMVDRFQALDDNGDGRVTVEEFNERASMLIAVMDRNGDGVLSREDRPRRGQFGREGREGQNRQ